MIPVTKVAGVQCGCPTVSELCSHSLGKGPIAFVFLSVNKAGGCSGASPMT